MALTGYLRGPRKESDGADGPPHPGSGSKVRGNNAGQRVWRGEAGFSSEGGLYTVESGSSFRSCRTGTESL